MTVDHSRQDHWRQLKDRHASEQQQVESDPALKGGGGGGTSGGGMEARIARLESDMEHVKKGVEKIDAGVSEIKKTLADMRVDAAKDAGASQALISTLEERTKHFPTRWEAFLVFSVIVAVIGGIVNVAVRLFSAT